VLGVNQLQTSLDSLKTAVQNLTQRLGGGAAASVPAAPPTLNQQATGGNGTSFPSAAGGYVPPAAGSYNSAAGTYTPPPAGPPGGGPPTMNQQAGGGNGGWGGTALGAFTGTVAGARAVIGSPLMSNIASQGSSMLSGMASMSSYLQAGAFYGGNAAGMTGQLRTLNDVATNANDLAQGLGMLSYSSGAWGTRNALYNGMSEAANMAGVLNPALGLVGSAKLGQQLYSQQMSMNMLSMGYGLTPRTMAGGTNSIQAVNSAILQRTFGGRSSVNQKGFNASAAPGGTLWYNLQALGLSGQNLTSTEQMLSAQNQLAGRGYTNNQINQLFTGVAHGNKGSISQLQQVFGPNANSILQTLKDKTALSTQRSGEEENGYQSGLAKSVQLLNQFNAALNKLMSGSLGKATGYAHGFTAGNGNSPTSWLEQGIAAGPLGIVGSLFGMPSVNVGGGAAATAPAANLSGMGPSNSSSSASMSAQANGSPGGKTGNGGQGKTAKTNSGISGAAKAAVGWAETQLGVPYLWGGEDPGVGFDCSGLMQWGYDKAGVKIPRTSQQQWAALGRSHSVPLDQVQAGDLIFTAGSDGTFDAPGHVAMMVNNRTLIQAEETGTNIMFTPYNPKQWDHAARPTGPGVAGTGPGTGGQGSSGTLTASGVGGASGFGGYSEGGGMGSTEEIDAISGGGGGYMSGASTGYTGGSGKSSSGGSGGGGPATPKTVTGDVKLGKQMAAAMGWSGGEWNALYNTWEKESGWRWNAQNPSSSAYGIPQALPGSKMASAGSDWRTDARTQIKWGLGYIKDRYHDPEAAWAHEQQFNWYSRGTQNAAKGLTVVGENGPEVIDNRSGGQAIMTAGQTSGLLSGLRSGQYGSSAGAGFTINVDIGSITVGGAVGGGSDVSSSAQDIGRSIGEYIVEDVRIRRLAAGV
jgi:cell wall-associated NlpC family hydrolase